MQVLMFNSVTTSIARSSLHSEKKLATRNSGMPIKPNTVTLKYVERPLYCVIAHRYNPPTQVLVLHHLL